MVNGLALALNTIPLTSTPLERETLVIFEEAKVARPNQPKKNIGFSTSRRFNVTESLPAVGTAEVWVFEAQYRFQDRPFGSISQPLSLTVSG
jgi:hypothetical protein